MREQGRTSQYETPRGNKENGLELQEAFSTPQTLSGTPWKGERVYILWIGQSGATD